MLRCTPRCSPTCSPTSRTTSTELTDWLADFSANWWFLLIIFVVAFLDSVIPIVPSETMVIIGGVAAGQGEQSLLARDRRRGGGRVPRRQHRIPDRRPHERLYPTPGRQAPEVAAPPRLGAEQIRVRGGLLLITARFIPGGRTVLTLSSGITHQPRRWFMFWIASPPAIWASYAALLGYFGGKTFEDDHTKAFLVAFGGAIGVTVVIEVVRHFRSKSHQETGRAHS